MVARIASRSLFALVACTIALLATSCADFGYNPKRDPALNVGKLKIEMKDRRLRRVLGPGTPAQWVDEHGQHVSVLLYRSGPNVLASVVDDHRVVGLEFFEHMTDADAHNEFTLPRAAAPYVTSTSIAQMSWLGAPVFSDSLPTPPPGWRVPTDFTVAQNGKSFYVTRSARAVSKERSKAYGWIVHLQ